MCLSLPDGVKEPVFGLRVFSGDLVPPQRPSGGLRATIPPRGFQGSGRGRGTWRARAPGSSLGSWASPESAFWTLTSHLAPHPNAAPSASASEAKRRARNSPQQPSAGEAVSQRDQVTPHSRRVRTQIQHWSRRERLGRPAGSQDPVT